MFHLKLQNLPTVSEDLLYINKIRLLPIDVSLPVFSPPEGLTSLVSYRDLPVSLEQLGSFASNQPESLPRPQVGLRGQVAHGRQAGRDRGVVRACVLKRGSFPLKT